VLSERRAVDSEQWAAIPGPSVTLSDRGADSADRGGILSDHGVDVPDRGVTFSEQWVPVARLAPEPPFNAAAPPLNVPSRVRV
jgi:hypothetical protein